MNIVKDVHLTVQVADQQHQSDLQEALLRMSAYSKSSASLCENLKQQ